MQWLEWLKMNWTWIAPLAVAILSTVLVKWCAFYGDDSPRAKKAIRFLLSLLASLPPIGAKAKGVRVMIGGLELAPPLISWAGPDTAKKLKTRAGSVLERVGLIFVVLLVGCSSWQATTRTALDGVSTLASYAPPAMTLQCDARRDACIAASSKVCEPLQSCHRDQKKVARGAVGAQGAVLGGLLAVEVGDKPRAAVLLAEAMKLIEPVRSILKAYGVTP